MKHLKLISLFSLFIILQSCSKEEIIEGENVEPSPKVPQLLTKQVTDATIYSLTISGSLLEPGDAEVTEVGFVVGYSSMPTIDENLAKTIAQLNEDNNFQMTYQSIPANTILYFRAYAISAAGVGYGNETLFTTLPDKVYEGNVWLTTQQEVIDFGENDYTSINGNIEISGEISDLTPLNSLIMITRGLTVRYSKLVDFTGLNNLKVVGSIGPNGFLVEYNHELVNFKGLENLETTRGGFTIHHNNSLENLEGLTNYEYSSLGEFRVESCPSLTSLKGVEKLEFVGDVLYIRGNDNVIDITALSNLDYVHDRIVIEANNSLQNINGLEKITQLGGLEILSNNTLTNLQGLRNLNSCKVLHINYNNALTDLSWLSNITTLDYLTIIGNNSLQNLQGLNNLTEIRQGNTKIEGNPSLINLNGLNGLRKVEGLYIRSNSSLTDMSALSTLTRINGGSLHIGLNSNLTSLNGFQNTLLANGNLQIYNNTSLNNFCGIKNMITPGVYVNINGNLNNPTAQEILDNCN